MYFMTWFLNDEHEIYLQMEIIPKLISIPYIAHKTHADLKYIVPLSYGIYVLVSCATALYKLHS